MTPDTSSRLKEFWRFEQERRRPFRRKYCVHPNASNTSCEGGIVRAHSIQRNGALTSLAREGHVYRLVADAASLERTGGIPATQLFGLKQASTFSGLCRRHDNDVFEPIEKRAFVASPLQCILLGYRSVLRETYTKRAAVEAMPAFREHAKARSGDERVRLEAFIDCYEQGLHIGLNSIEAQKERFECAMAGDEFVDLRYAVVYFDRVPDVMTASSWFPTSDFDGNQLANYAKLGVSGVVPDMVSFTVFGAGGKGAAVISWLSDSDAACNQFVASFLGQGPDRLSDLLIQLAFRTSENTYIRPDWWDSLSSHQRDRLILRSLTAVHPKVPYRPDDLVDDEQELANWGASCVTWRVTHGETVLELKESYRK